MIPLPAVPDDAPPRPLPLGLPSPVPRAGGLAWVPRSGASLAPGFLPLLPFQFPSLSHYDARVAQVLLHLRDVDGLQPSTLHWIRSALGHFRRFLADPAHARAFLGGDPRGQVAVLHAWVGALRAGGRTHATVNNYWRALQIACKRLTVLDGILSPLSLVPTPPAGRRNPRFLTRPAAEQLLAFVADFPWPSRLARARNLAVVGLLLLAGLRRGEAVRLRNGDVDPEAGTIRIVRGKGRFGGKDRTAYMPPQLAALLRDYVAARAAAGRTHPEFLTSLTRDRGIGAPAVRALLARASHGLGTAVTPHMLRHTYATLLRQAGVSDRLAMDLLGHASLTALQRYSHVIDGEHAAAAAQLALDVRL